MPDLATLISMFPLIDPEVITAVYESTNNNFDGALNQLLEMADPSQQDLINREKIIAVMYSMAHNHFIQAQGIDQACSGYCKQESQQR